MGLHLYNTLTTAVIVISWVNTIGIIAIVTGILITTSSFR